MKYRVTDQEVQERQAEYKRNYKPFRPFVPSAEHTEKLGSRFCQLLTTQNGQDTDDYSVEDNNKVERYLSFLPAGSKVLILGAGTGREVLTAKSIGLQPIGTTLGSRNVDYGHEYLCLPDHELRECINEALPFDSASFDCVCGFQVFEHTLSPLIFLLEQRRVLKSGGVILLEWPPAKDYHMGANPHHQICFSPGQAESLLQKAGFAEIELFYDDLSPVADEDKWRCDQSRMLVVKARKYNTDQRHVLDFTGES